MRIYNDKKLNRPASWCVEIKYRGIRRRKYFKNYVDAKHFDVTNWLKRFDDEPDGYDTSVKVAIKKYIENYQIRYPTADYKKIQSRLDYLIKWGFGDRKVDKIDAQVLSRKVAEQETWRTSSSKFTYKNQFVIFLNWCGLMGYCQRMEWKIKTLRMPPKDREIGVLTPVQTEELLNAVLPQYKPALAIMLFAGIRPQGEMSKLDYSNIKHGDSISVPASKTPARLITELPENLWSWVPCRSKGNVMPSWNAMRQHRARVSEKLGFKYPADGARHSFGSYGYWSYGLEWAMHTMGHMDYQTFKTYYMNKKVTPASAKKYFSITCVSDINV